MFEFWKKLGIYQLALVLTLTPLIVISISLGYYNATTRLADLRKEMVNRGESLARNFASASEYGIYIEDVNLLKKLAASVLNEPDVDSVLIVDNNGNELITLGSSLNMDSILKEKNKNNSLIFVSKVIRSNLPSLDNTEYYDSDANFIKNNTQENMGKVIIALSESSVRKRQKEVIFNGVLITIVVLLFGAIFASLIASGVVSPLRRISDVTRRIAKGEYKARIPVISGGELGKLENDINVMASKIDESTTHLTVQVENATSELQDTVTQLRERNKELEDAKIDAMKAGLAKTEFLANMSHEIRTPLNAIIGFARLTTNSRDSHENTKYLNTIRIAAEQLQETVDDILIFSKLDASTSKIQKNELVLEKLIEDVISLHGSQAHDKNIELIYFIEKTVPQKLIGDAHKISQILNNLVSNAIKFTEHGYVAIKVSGNEISKQMSEIQISVEDTGKGIGVEKKDYLFEAFSQEDATITRNYGGTGLGLAICKKLVDMMNGNIFVTSSYGAGSVFTVKLPMLRIDSRNLEDPLSTNLIGYKALLIEKHPLARRAIRNMLLSFGMQVFVESNYYNPRHIITKIENKHGKLDVVIYSNETTSHIPGATNSILNVIRTVYDGFLLFATTIETIQNSVAEILDNKSALIEKPIRSDSLRTILLENLKGLIDVKEISQVPVDDMEMMRLLKNKRILIAEDNKFNQLLLESILIQYHPIIKIVNDGSEANLASTEEQFDLIFLDLHMPNMDGITACKYIRKSETNAAAIIIAVTADVLSMDNLKYKKELFDGVIYKPISKTDLCRTIRNQVVHKYKNKHTKKTSNPLPDMNRLMVPNSKNPMEAQEHLKAKFFEELRLQVNALTQALTKEDFNKLKRHSHQLKGIAGYFGYKLVEMNAKAIEKAVEYKDISEIKMYLSALKKAIET
jgi:two-component system sensor histidine kinase BarA